MIDVQYIKNDISNLKQYWEIRNRKFRDWYEILLLVDILASKGMETYVSNEPQTFYNMAHYLLTTGELTHGASMENEMPAEQDRRARLNRGCQYLWKVIDRNRQLGGAQPFIDTLGFFLLVLGWYSIVNQFDRESGLLKTQVWNPHDTYPSYANERLFSCVHSYTITFQEAIVKAEANGWEYPKPAMSGDVTLDDYFVTLGNNLYNMVFIDSLAVTGLVPRPDMELLVAPVGGFPDKGSLSARGSNKTKAITKDWRKLAGRGIFEVNEQVLTSMNKWKSMVSQTLADTVNPITQEFSASPQATPEQLRQRGALFHYAPGEAGLQRVSSATIPIEVQAHMLEMRREYQKGSFTDVVHGMVESGSDVQAGYSLSLLASSSANQILYPYMDAKHFVLGECDRFWLSNLKKSGKSFSIKGRVIEKIEAKDIPEEVNIEVESDIATPKDWLQRATIANMLDKHLDEATILTEIYKVSDPQAIQRRRQLDRMLNHPMSQMVEMIAGYHAHADYLSKIGDSRQASLFRRVATQLEGQLSVPPAGQGNPANASTVASQRMAGAPAKTVPVAANVASPEESGGFTPAQLRSSIGRGTAKGVK